MVKVCPAMVKELDWPPLPFESTLNVTLPLPKPEPALVSETLAGNVPTLHGQPGCVVMVMDPAPLEAAKAGPLELNEYVHSLTK